LFYPRRSERPNLHDIAEVCHREKTASKFKIQKIVYQYIKERYGLTAQLVIRAIAKACEAYKINRKVKPKFKRYGSVVYDQRILSFKLKNFKPEVSLATVEGRKRYEIEVRDYFKGRMERVKGQVDLVFINGEFWLYATCDMPEDTPITPDHMLGVDFGMVNIATTSDGESYSGEKLEKVRMRFQAQRERLQKKNTKYAKEKLKKVSGKERRFRTDTNHVVSKRLVGKAKDTASAIALENLTHINERTTVRKSQRARRNSWSFFQLRQFVQYKARLAGIPVFVVDARNTSRTCSSCGHCEKANRKNQAEFCCRSCGHEENADHNAAKNIARHGPFQPAYCRPSNHC
jgi:putative transposase